MSERIVQFDRKRQGATPTSVVLDLVAEILLSETVEGLFDVIVEGDPATGGVSFRCRPYPGTAPLPWPGSSRE